MQCMLTGFRYIGNEAAAKAAFDKEGFFITGDLGLVGGNEYIF